MTSTTRCRFDVISTSKAGCRNFHFQTDFNVVFHFFSKSYDDSTSHFVTHTCDKVRRHKGVYSVRFICQPVTTMAILKTRFFCCPIQEYPIRRPFIYFKDVKHVTMGLFIYYHLLIIMQTCKIGQGMG